MFTQAYSKGPIFLNKDAKAALGLGKKIFFATGNAFYPTTRYSLGIYTINQAVERFKFKWQEHQQYVIAEGEKVVFIKPKVWLPEKTADIIKMSLERMSIKSLDNLTVLTSNLSKEIGFSQPGVGETEENIPIVNELIKSLQTDKFQWIALGVGAPEARRYDLDETVSTLSIADKEEFDSLFMYCRVPTAHLQVFKEKTVTPLLDQWFTTYAAD